MAVRTPFLDPADAAAQLIALNDRGARQAMLATFLPQLDIKAFLPFLQDEAYRYFSINGDTSLRYAETLIDAADLVNQPRYRAFGLLFGADAYHILGRYTESFAHYEEARAVFAAIGDEVGWARTFIGWIHVANMIGRGREALDAVDAAHAVFMHEGERLLAAKLDQNTAYVQAWRGQYDAALHHFDRAQQIAESLGASGEMVAARAKNNKADIYALRGDFDIALALYADARAGYERMEATREIHRQDLFIADLRLSQGDFTHSLRLYTDTLAALEQEGEDGDAAEAGLKLAACYLSLNRNHEALALAEETISRFERGGAPLLAAKARFACALALARLAENNRALDLLENAAQTFAAADFTADVGLAALQRALLYLSEGDVVPARTEAERARALFAERGLVIRQTQADVVCARTLFDLGAVAEAAAFVRAALATADARNLRWLTPECHHVLAQIARLRGDARDALRECLHAIQDIEQVQTRLAIELRGAFLADKLQVYHDAIDCCLALSDPQQAFLLLERAKSRALVDYLDSNPGVRIRPPQEAHPELIEELHHLREEHNWLYNRLYGYEITREPGDPQAEGEALVLEAAIRDREKQIARLLERLALHRSDGTDHSEGFPLIAASSPTLPTLDADTVLLEYYFHEGGGAVFVITGGELTVVDLAVSLDSARRLVHRWHLNLETTARAVAAGQPLGALARNAVGILQSLYRALLAPVAPLLASHRGTRLVIVPYGPTHAVPFHALHDGSRYLVESVEVTVCPSSDLLRLCDARVGRRTTQTALIVAHSNDGQLPFVREEAAIVAGLFPSERFEEAEATRAAFIAAAPGHGIVHLAAHAEARLDNPTFAHLKLADGQLNPTDIFNLDLDGALVTLSGCETGRSTVVGGDELIGLSRGFLFAGAATLVQSLWRVEDGSTARLMEHFYAGLGAGAAPGAALRAAQCALLAAPDTGAHPFIWAPFQLVGAGGRRAG